ncbi:hypothetical protein MSEO_00600 [Mycobacterium seoulense]|uniref:Uncharacterized protein n=1 Tax=Mycobacterium seoulense TaxID=386911 RepID=A0A7I7NSP4_9MYCO|nr:hypothetical protein MSEO_00600 [Mycobacterium seoulense]
MSKVGPGPNETNGTVTTASNTPKTRIGTSATIKVRIRLFTPITLDGAHRPRFSHKPTRDRPLRSRGEYR